MEKGKLIVMEGACDGIGKTTQFKLLRSRLSEQKMVFTHHFPTYDTYHGKAVEEYLAGNFGKPSELSPYFINNLYAADRAIVWQTLLKRHFDDGETILLDRYTTSSLIYQAALIEDLDKKREFLKFVTDYEYEKLEIGEPNIVIFLTAPFDLVTEMRVKRSVNEGLLTDIHETDLNFMKKVYDNAHFVAEYLEWCKVQCNDGNKMRDVEDIHEEIFEVVSRPKQLKLGGIK